MQPVAISGKSTERGNGGNTPKHGKEGVDGSSPIEGFVKFLLISCFVFWSGDAEEARSDDRGMLVRRCPKPPAPLLQPRPLRSACPRVW